MRSAVESPAACAAAGVAPPPSTAAEGGRAGGAAIEPSGWPGPAPHAGELPSVNWDKSGEASAAYSDERGVLGPAPMQEGPTEGHARMKGLAAGAGPRGATVARAACVQCMHAGVGRVGGGV